MALWGCLLLTAAEIRRWLSAYHLEILDNQMIAFNARSLAVWISWGISLKLLPNVFSVFCFYIKSHWIFASRSVDSFFLCKNAISVENNLFLRGEEHEPHVFPFKEISFEYLSAIDIFYLGFYFALLRNHRKNRQVLTVDTFPSWQSAKPDVTIWKILN